MTASEMIDLDAEPSGRRYPPRFRWQALAVAAIVPLCLLVLRGGQPAAVGLSRPLWTVDPGSTDFVVGARTVYTSEPMGIVTARDLRTGEVLWTIRTDHYPTAVVDAGALAAVAAASGHAGTRLIDRSGTVLARLPGFPVGTTRSGRRLLAVEHAGSPDCPDAVGVCAHVTAWDLDTRSVAWSADIADLALDMDGGARIDALATISGDGTIEVRDPDTGGVRDRLRPLPHGIAARPETSVIISGTDIVTIVRSRDEGAEITLFRPRAIG